MTPRRALSPVRECQEGPAPLLPGWAGFMVTPTLPWCPFLPPQPQDSCSRCKETPIGSVPVPADSGPREERGGAGGGIGRKQPPCPFF